MTALDKYNIKATRTYRPGTVYIMIGCAPILTWEEECARKQLGTDTERHFNLDSYQIESLSEVVDPFETSPYLKTVVLDSTQSLDFKSNFKIASNLVLQIHIDTTFSTKDDVKRMIENVEDLESDYIKVFDLTKVNFLTRKCFKEWYENLSSKEQKIVENYFQNPWMLASFKSEELTILNNDVPIGEEDDEKTIDYFLSTLGKKEGLYTWGSVDNATAYKVFLTPDPTSSGAYMVLAGGISQKGSNKANSSLYEKWKKLSPSLSFYKGEYKANKGKCGELYYYFDFFLKAFQERWRYFPRAFMLFFASWVYLTNNKLATNYQKGLTKVESRYGVSFYNFNPSDRAIAIMKRVTNSY
jgi:hypothetical protein